MDDTLMYESIIYKLNFPFCVQATNLKSKKLLKVFKLTNKKSDYKILGTSIINSPMSLPSPLLGAHSTPINQGFPLPELTD